MTGGPDKGLERLFGLIVELNEREALREVSALLDAGVAPGAIMICFNRALGEIGRLFQIQQYYMVALVLAGELMREALGLLMPRLSTEGGPAPTEGRVIIATIEGDIHDLGKSLAGFLLTASGFEVVDLGVDVPPRIILAEALKLGPVAVGVSLLLTACVPAVQRLALLFRETYGGEPGRPVLFAGCALALPPESASSPPQWLGVDAVAKDAYESVQICLGRASLTRAPGPAGPA